MANRRGHHNTVGTRHPRKGVTLKKSRGICLKCYDSVDYLYLTNGVEMCYHCSRGIKK